MSDDLSPPTLSPPAQTEAPLRHRYTGWTTGILLILIGVVFLIQNLTGSPIQNWWALFILIPAGRAFSRAWERLKEQGFRFTRHVTRAMFTGLLFVTLTTVFLFNLDWSLVVPVLLILLGLSGLMSAVLK